MNAAAAAAPAGLIRYPDISAREIVFTYADDLWLVARDGGVARRLTSSGGDKRARFSPDGTRLAYSALRDGRSQAFVLDRAGGVPRPLSHHPAPTRVAGWTPDGRSVLVASTMASERPNFNRLFLMPPDGGLPEALPLPFGETGAFSPDGRLLAYTWQRDQQEESWKRYRGGRAPKLWLFDRSSGTTRPLTDGASPDSEPIWIGTRIYFLSERGAEQRSNLWVVDAAGGAPRQLTRYADVDVRFPSGGSGGIVFTIAGRLMRLDPATERVSAVEVEIADERPAPGARAVGDQFVNVDAGAAGQAAIEAHGDVFTLAVASGAAQNRSATPNAAERFPALAPDGRTLAYFSDADGEYQLVLRDLASNQARTLTRFTEGLRFKPQWSPDSRQIVFIDWRGDLHLGHVESADHDAAQDQLQLLRGLVEHEEERIGAGLGQPILQRRIRGEHRGGADGFGDLAFALRVGLGVGGLVLGRGLVRCGFRRSGFGRFRLRLRRLRTRVACGSRRHQRQQPHPDDQRAQRLHPGPPQ